MITIRHTDGFEARRKAEALLKGRVHIHLVLIVSDRHGNDTGERLYSFSKSGRGGGDS